MSKQAGPNGSVRKTRRIESFFAGHGPGLITGCADDDPSGISTYSISGAGFGYSLLWTALLTFPLTIALQLMCGRLGMVTRHGLAEMIRRRYSKWVLWAACALLMSANVVNIAADLAGMGAATHMVTGIPALVWTPLFAALILGFLLWSSYRQIARIFKWITLVLAAYIVTGFFAHVEWRTALLQTFVPHISWSREYISVLVGILGTTISPYLFFWQSSQEVEEQRALGRPVRGKGASRKDLKRLKIDVVAGMFASNLIMYFVILTTAATLHAHGETQIGTAKQAAEALRPLAGDSAYLLFTLGLIGTGMLGVPVLAGSCAYAIAEAAAWRGTLEAKPPDARKFYGVLAAALLIGLSFNYAGLNAVKMLFWAAVVNGVLAPPLILMVVLLAGDRKVMGDHVTATWEKILGWITFALMAGAALALAFV